MSAQTTILTDRRSNINLDSFVLDPGPWSVVKRTLRGGLSEGVEVVDVDNGLFSFTILPTRGMGLYSGKSGDVDLGWQAPVLGPVHPKFVELSARNGLGWLTGFDEWMCRCGLAWNGPPGDDAGFPLTLHGRIANLPAHRLEVVHDPDARTISVIGEVEEGGLFYPHLHLRTEYTTAIGSNVLSVSDEVTNRSSRPVEMQLLYHVNFGPPLLGDGSRVRVPVARIWPNDERAAAGIETRERCGPPTSGFVEQVYLIEPRADADGRTLAVLHDATASRGVAIRWATASLPYFNLWKNTGAIEDGYVVGLEPATGFPRFRAREREAGRVRRLAPGEAFDAAWSLVALTSAEQVALAVGECERVQGDEPPQIQPTLP